jgi:hypothetical protein
MEYPSAGEPHKNKILVVAHPSCNTRALIQRIIGEELRFKTLKDSALSCVEWTIDTKYYTADVEFWITCEDIYPPEKQSQSFPPESLGDACEAVMLVFDINKNDMFENLKGWTRFIEEYSPNVLLCVGMGQSENSQITHDYHIWCVDNGLEFVELDKMLGKRADDFEGPIPDKEGVDRIIEALQSTVWCNLVHKSKQILADHTRPDNNTVLPSLPESLQNHAESTTKDENGSLEKKFTPNFDPMDETEFGKFLRGEFADSLNNNADLRADLGDLEISANLNQSKNFLSEIEETNNDSHGQSNNEVLFGEFVNSEEKVGQFEKVMMSLQKLRDNAQKLPDMERRYLAATVVSLLFPNEDDW